MDVVKLFEQISFHDSVVNHLVLDLPTSELRLKVELGNYNQVGYNPEIDPETIQGDLLFVGVTHFEHDPEDALAIWDKGVDGEIIHVETVPMDRDGASVKLVIVVTDYRSKVSTTYVFRFVTTGAMWIPESAQPG